MPNILLVTLMGLMPLIIMTNQSLPSTVFYLVLAASLVKILTGRNIGRAIPGPAAGAGADTSTGPEAGSGRGKVPAGLVPCMAGLLFVVLFSSLWHGRLASHDLEFSLRFLFGVWLPLLALGLVPPRLARQIIWGYAAAAMAAVAFVVYLYLVEGGRPETSAVYNAVGYGNHTLMLGVLMLLSLKWTVTAWPRAERAIKVFLGLAALAAFVLTMTRSGWVAVPVFVVIGGFLAVSQMRPARIAMAIAVLGVLMAAVFLGNDTLRERATIAYEETMACQDEQSTANTSICIRLQLWRASLDMLAEQPLAGNGDRRLFGEYLQSRSLPKGLVSEYTAKGWGEPHNDLMLALASFGVPGGLALLLIYLGPSWIFLRRMAFHNSAGVRTAAAMGLAFCLGMMIFGFTETMFRGMRSVSYYALTVALFMALSDPGRQDRGTSLP